MKRDSPTKNYLTVADAAYFASISRRSLYKFLHDPVNPLPHFRLGTTGRLIRIKKDDLENWMENFRAGNMTSIDVDKWMLEIATS